MVVNDGKWWEMMINYLVDGIPTPLKNMTVNGKDQFMFQTHVPNHQADFVNHMSGWWLT